MSSGSDFHPEEPLSGCPSTPISAQPRTFKHHALPLLATPHSNGGCGPWERWNGSGRPGPHIGSGPAPGVAISRPRARGQTAATAGGRPPRAHKCPTRRLDPSAEARPVCGPRNAWFRAGLTRLRTRLRTRLARGQYGAAFAHVASELSSGSSKSHAPKALRHRLRRSASGGNRQHRPPPSISAAAPRPLAVSSGVSSAPAPASACFLASSSCGALRP